MSRWAVYDERRGGCLGYVDAVDRAGAIAAAVGKFQEAVLDLVWVRRIVNVPPNIPIDPALIRRIKEAPPKQLPSEETLDDDGPAPIGEEDWRDGPRDDGSYDSDEILPE